MTNKVEQDLRVWEQPRVTREETTGGMGLILAGIVGRIEARRTALELENDPMISESVDVLVQRSLILVNGIKKRSKSGRLAEFLKRSSNLYELNEFLIKSANNSFDLRDRVNRFGEALQGDMNLNQLLTEKAKNDLHALDEPKTGDVVS